MILLLATASCDPVSPSAVPTMTPASPLPTSTIPPSPTPEPTPSPGKQYWAISAFSDSITADPDFAGGEPDVKDCSEPVLPVWAPLASDQPEIPDPELSSALNGQPA